MIVRSPLPEIAIPDVPLTPFLLASAARYPDKPALIDGPSGRTLTHGDWAIAVRKAAAGLAARGFGKGDVLALVSPNVPEYAVAFHAVSLLGGVVTTANPTYTAGELAFQLRDAKARLVVTVPACLERTKQAAAGTSVDEIFVFGEAIGATPFASLFDAGDSPPGVRLDPAVDAVALPYSSGTTGLSKGVMLTHRNIVANTLQTCASVDALTAEDTLVGVLPFFHIYGLVAVLQPAFHLGATLVVLPRFDLEMFLETLQTHRVSVASIVPPIVLALAKHPVVDRYDLSALKLIMSGAAPLGADLAEACARRLGCTVIQGYGLTETSPVTHVCPSAPGRVRAGSVGVPVPNTECRILDLTTGAELGPDRDGEICIRGPQVMKGYLNNPEATRQMIDADGWLHTGDVGRVDADGYFYVVDRVKELIKYKGLPVAPAELEALLLTHPAVADTAVVPAPDAEAGEVPKAFVVLKGEATPDELIAYVAGRVSPHKKIRRVEVVDAIPKSAAGKILRRVLVERERTRSAARPS
jgi:acyl-CoA synthetase (AMP-forming)/AMP-acid ligase II